MKLLEYRIKVYISFPFKFSLYLVYVSIRLIIKRIIKIIIIIVKFTR